MFSERLVIRLIRQVKDHPVLYDYNDGKYLDFNAREVAWQKIGDELQKPAHECKARWINIRDVHRRIFRKSLNPNTRPKPYRYEKEMKFMRAYYKNVTSVDGNEECEEEEDRGSIVWNEPASEGDNEYLDIPEASCSDEYQKPIKERKNKNSKKRKFKRKRSLFVKEEKPVSIKSSTSLNETQCPELDSTDTVDAFLISIGATLKTFSPYHLNVAKTKIFGIVQEHDLQQIVEKQQDDSGVKVMVSNGMNIVFDDN